MTSSRRLAVLATSLLIAAPAIARAQGAMGSSTGRPVGGIACDAQEGQRIHIHQHLAIFDNGKPVPIPSDVGRPQLLPCLYWLHTHTPDGILHIEAPLDRSFSLGDFFNIWGKALTTTEAASAKAPKGTTLKVWVNGKPFTGDPRTIKLTQHADIVIQSGPTFIKPPVFTGWGPL